MKTRGFFVERQKAIELIWEDQKMDCSFRADLIVDGKVLIELKSVEALAPVHHKQVLTYLKITEMRLGLLINFNVDLIKNGFHRVANRL